jgi:hypothetical protein
VRPNAVAAGSSRREPLVHEPYDRPALDTTADTLRAEWSSAIIERGRAVGPLPIFGSVEWAALPPNCAQAVAACVVAAEAHRHYTDPTTVRRELELELLADRQVAERRAAEDFAELAAGVRALSLVPTQDVLAERRAVVAA